jgi:TolA-binding protein
VISRLRGLLAAYPGSEVEPQALLLLGQVYVETEQVEAAKGTLAELVQRYPDTDEAKRAKNILGKIG